MLKNSKVLGAKKTILWIEGLQILVPRRLRYMSTKSHIHETYRTLKKHHFPQRDMMKFTYKGHFLTMKIAYEKFLD
jgi:hypothetical protein